MTLLIKAYPEEEYKRLRKAVLDMPISNPDKKERFLRYANHRTMVIEASASSYP